MLNIRQLIALWIGTLLTLWMWVGSASFPVGSDAERIDMRYAGAFAVITVALVITLAERKK